MSKRSQPERKEYPTQDPNLNVVLCDDGSRTLKCKARGITWHSESGAVTESQLVFLENSGVADMLCSDQKACVFEVGFGTGLNFWLTASLALQKAALLEYVSLEPNPLQPAIASSLQYDEIESCNPATEHFSLTIGRQQYENVTLDLLQKRFEEVDRSHYRECFDAVFHDPFGPEAAPELWTTGVFERLNSLLKPNGRLVTYCVKSEVQRRLSTAGFVVSKTRGPVGGKREVLIATKN